MDEMQNILSDTATRLFSDNRNAALEADGEFNRELWTIIQELGFTTVLVPEANGGVGGNWKHVQAILRPAGYHSIPLPCGEAILAAQLLNSAGITNDAELVVAAPSQGRLYRSGDAIFFDGALRAVPWGRYTNAVVTTAELNGVNHVALLPTEHARVREFVNLANEPRDQLHFNNVPVTTAPCETPTAKSLLEHAMLLRLAQILGAMEHALDLSVSYANERQQFGRVIGKFQAVQQQLAVCGAEVAAVNCAVRAAFDAVETSDADWQIAAAKIRTNTAIGTVCTTAHQVHAAIGFTWEHALRLSTQRLLSWRGEYGNDRYWSTKLGAAVAQRGADNFWQDLTQRDDKVNSA